MKNKLILQPGQVDIWQAYPPQINAPDILTSLKRLLCAEELEQLKQVHRPSERHTRLVSRALVRFALSQYINIAPDRLKFSRAKQGKPALVNNPEICFNLSHGPDLVTCAITLRANVGIDVERIRYRPSLLTHCRDLLDQKEIDDLESHQGSDRMRRFFDYWTLKESFIKATGTGFSVPVNNIVFTPGEVRAELTPPPPYHDRKWQSCVWPLGTHHRLALTIENDTESPADIRCFHFIPQAAEAA